MASVLVGRLMGPRCTETNSACLLGFCASGAVTLVIVSMLTRGYTSVIVLVMYVGDVPSPVHPQHQRPRPLHQNRIFAAHHECCGRVGGATVPPIIGLISDGQGIRLAFAAPVRYAYIVFYGLRGHMVSTPVSTNPLTCSLWL